MKKVQWFINGLVIAGLLTLGGYHLLNKEKTVYVDIGRLMQEYQGMKDAKAEFEKKNAQWQANADTLIAQWQEELKDYEKERITMSKKERELKEELLRNKQQQIAQYQEAVKQKTRDEEQLLTQNVLNRINDFMDKYGKKHGYNLILGANGSGNIVYAKKSMDITDDMLEQLHLEYQNTKE